MKGRMTEATGAFFFDLRTVERMSSSKQRIAIFPTRMFVFDNARPLQLIKPIGR